MYPSARLHWIDEMLGQLRRQEFNSIIWRDPEQPEGKRLYVRPRVGTVPYVLQSWVEGRWPAPTSAEDMRACAVLLAGFHQAGRKCIPPQRGLANMIGKWPQLFNKQYAVLKQKINKAKQAKINRSRNALDNWLNKYGDDIIRRARAALAILRDSGYESACAAAREQGNLALCHGDGGPTNFLINNKGIYLLDFETLRIDLRAYDLYRIIHNSCKDYKWNFEIARHILEGYDAVEPLNPTDFALLKVWLRFPRGIFKQLNRYDKVRNKVGVLRLLSELNREDKMKDQFLDQLDRYDRGRSKSPLLINYRKDNDG